MSKQIHQCIVLLAVLLIPLSSVTRAQDSVTILNSLFQTPMVSGPLVQGVDGKLYGAAPVRGANHTAGTVFRLSPRNGKLARVYDFCAQPWCSPGTDGEFPNGSLLPMADGSFYGATLSGGANDWGTIFRVTPAGNFSRVYDFCSQPNCTDGRDPSSEVTLGPDGNFYGTTGAGGNSTDSGTVFQLTPAGKLTTLYNFCADGSPNQCPDGVQPQAPLLLARNGNLYGSTYFGGDYQWSNYGSGTLFRITPDGTFTQIHVFCSQNGCPDGAGPAQALIQGSDGNLYGTTSGSNLSNGTIFQLTPRGVFSVLHNFCLEADCLDGKYPSGLTQATDGNFYGTTNYGGLYGAGTIFEITPVGQFTQIYSFCSESDCADGGNPLGGLVQATSGGLYGLTSTGGGDAVWAGTAFRVDIGSRPFIKLVPNSGAAGSNVTIMGNNLSRATGVSFNRTVATFTIVSNTQISAVVPPGATSGPVSVSTLTNPIKSNLPFQVE